jgi:phosphate transport system permease protein
MSTDSLNKNAHVSAGEGMPDLTHEGMDPLRTLTGRVLTILTGVFTAIVVIPLLVVLYAVAEKGLNRLRIPESFTQLPPAPGLQDGGFGHAFIGTLMTLGIAAAIAVPFGVLAAIYMAEFGKGTRIAYFVKFSANVLTGVPAVLCGLFAYSIVVVPMGHFSAFSGGVALSVLMLPIIMRATEEALLLVPNEMRQASVGIGATRLQTILYIVVPATLPALVTGVILALARAAGEAAPLLFTAFNNNFWSTNPNGPVATLPVLIYFFSIIPYKVQQEMAWAAALVLLAIVLVCSVTARFFTRAKTY